MVEMSSSGSGEGPGRVTGRGYSTSLDVPRPFIGVTGVSRLVGKCINTLPSSFASPRSPAPLAGPETRDGWLARQFSFVLPRFLRYWWG